MTVVRWGGVTGIDAEAVFYPPGFTGGAGIELGPERMKFGGTVYQRLSWLNGRHRCCFVITRLDPVIPSSTVLKEMAGSGWPWEYGIAKSRSKGRPVLTPRLPAARLHHRWLPGIGRSRQALIGPKGPSIASATSFAGAVPTRPTTSPSRAEDFPRPASRGTPRKGPTPSPPSVTWFHRSPRRKR